MSFRANVLCDLASDWLAERYPESLIVRELSVGNWGSALIDIAAILPNEIVGIEIKGDGDSSARLKLQGAVYSRVASRMFLLSAPSLDMACRKHLPRGWLHLRVSEGAITHPVYSWDAEYEHEALPTAPAALLEALCGRELKALALEFGLADKGHTRIGQWTLALSEHVPLGKLRPAVCRKLRERDWLKFDRSLNKARPERYRWAVADCG